MSSSTKAFTVELESGKVVTVEVTASAEFDSSYGADADGNRGMGMYFMDDVEYTLPKVDEKGEALTDDEMDELDNALNEEIDGYSWEFSEPDYEYENDDF